MRAEERTTKALRGCSVRMADGKEITPAVVPPVVDGTCVLAVEEYLALDGGTVTKAAQ